MHEYPITQEIIRIAADHAEKANACKVTCICLVVGEQSGLVGESIQMYFDILAEGTLCEGAMLEVKNIKTQWHCPRCDLLYTRKPLSFACPSCGLDGDPTDIGKEFYVDTIEVEL